MGFVEQGQGHQTTDISSTGSHVQRLLWNLTESPHSAQCITKILSERHGKSKSKSHNLVSMNTIELQSIVFIHMEKIVFLTQEAWRHPNPSLQALVAPAQAWQCVSVDEMRPSLLLEVKHLDPSELPNWILSSSMEDLVDMLTHAPERIGAVQALVPGSLNKTGSWHLEPVVGIDEWVLGNRIGLECHTESGERYAFVPRPANSHTRRQWKLPSGAIKAMA